MPIRVLAESVASQIAAGEVVERPASVVKELMENSLDAGATTIKIRIEQAGRRLIEVSDDGSGIHVDELQLALGRHATSKLFSTEDLFRIRSLGFRGEALASIGSVSKLLLVSRSHEESVGGKVYCEAGIIKGVDKSGVPEGTVVRVEDLFFNVPARLKFLKTDMTERTQINGLVTRYAMAYPHVRFFLEQDGKLILRTQGNGDQREVLAQLYGADVARQMLEVQSDEERATLCGFISPIALTRSNRREITFFVNGRWIQDVTLTTALVHAYHTLLMVGRYPLGFILLDLDPSDVDVNVHPAKAEVRFREPDRVFSLVQRSVKRALLAYSPVPQASGSYWQSISPQRAIDPAWGFSMDAASSQSAGEQQNASGESNQILAQPALPTGKIPLLRLIGQIGAAYLVAEGPDGLYLIDQHAAHERVLFEKFQKKMGSQMPSQTLLEGVIVQLSAQSAEKLSSQLDLLRGLGFDIEEFGFNSFRVTAIPAILVGADPDAAVRVVVEDFEEDETPLQAEVEAKIIARICKRSAVKAGKILSDIEQRALITDLEECHSPRTCPHGRPTMIHLSVDLLERQFGRRGAR